MISNVCTDFLDSSPGQLLQRQPHTLAFQFRASFVLWMFMGSNSEVHERSPQESRGCRSLTCEEIHTLLCLVECCLNSHPLLPLNTHSDDGLECLALAIFQLEDLQVLPLQDLTDIKMPLLKTWSRNITHGDIMLIREDIWSPQTCQCEESLGQFLDEMVTFSQSLSKKSSGLSMADHKSCSTH